MLGILNTPSGMIYPGIDFGITETSGKNSQEIKKNWRWEFKKKQQLVQLCSTSHRLAWVVDPAGPCLTTSHCLDIPILNSFINFFELRTIVSYEPEETATTEKLVNYSFKVSFIQNLKLKDSSLQFALLEIFESVMEFLFFNSIWLIKYSCIGGDGSV